MNPSIPKDILLADDDTDDRNLFYDALKEVCKTVSLRTAIDGKELIDMLCEPDAKLPDLIFLDVNMPRMNGIQCLQEIRSNDALKHIHVIIFSTSAKLSLVNLVFEEGADFFIQKPFDYEKLKKVIEETICKDWIAPLIRSRENFLITAE